MARKKKDKVDFVQERSVLDFRPNINFIEPDQIEDNHPPIVPETTIQQIRNNTDDLINDYKRIQDLCDLAQDRITDRAKNISIKLDPNLDAHVLDALRRHTGDPNKTEITFDDYLECLDHINEKSADNFTTARTKIQNQFETGFGSLGFPPGLSRPELQEDTKSIDPIDLKSFQVQIIQELLKLLTPGITKIALDQAKKAITGG